MFRIDEKTQKISLTKGDSAGFNVSISNIEGEEYSLQNGDVIKLTVRKKANSPVVIEAMADAEGNIYLVPEDTNSLTPGLYVYDVELSNHNVVNTIIPLSYFEICQEVSQ